MKMEENFGHDDRFRVDQRFLNEENMSSSSEEDEEHGERKNERNKEFSILSKVLGKTVASSIPVKFEKKNNKVLPVCPFHRYDPANPEHVAWLKSVQTKKNTNKETVFYFFF